jgi:hypothetical protein
VGDKELIRAIRSAADRLHLTDVEVAALAGVSVPTAGAILRDGRMPRMSRCVRGLAALAARATSARARGELGLP